jgi:hypothetical protein
VAPTDKPLPGWAEKDQLENELHAKVCAGKITLADAQKCIASNWVQCWENYVVAPLPVAVGSGVATRLVTKRESGFRPLLVSALPLL